MINLFRINDWPRKNLIYSVIFLLVSYDLVYLLSFWFVVPFLFQILGFILLIFIPGILILRVLKIHNDNDILNIILVIGLSLFFIMIMGLILNEIGFLLKEPLLSPTPIVIALNLTFLILLFFISKLDDLSQKEIPKIKVHYICLLLMVFIPGLAILGSYLVNNFSINYLTIELILILGTIPLFYKDERYHGLLIWISAFSILLSMDLISNYLWGWDIHQEFYAANLVFLNHSWNPNFSMGINSLLSVVIVPPMYSFILKLDLVWVYKVIFPFLFSFVPLGIYYFTSLQLKNKLIAFFSALLFIFYYGFFKDMIDKQFIAELFLILLLIIISRKITNYLYLLIMFIVALPLSHYGISYLMIFGLIFSLILFFILKQKNEIPITAPMILFIIALTWYIYTAAGVNFSNIVGVGKYAISSLPNLFTIIQNRTGLSYLNANYTGFAWQVYKIMNILLILFIFIGIAKMIFDYIKKKYSFSTYIFGSFAICFGLFLCFEVFEPLSLGIDRALQITLTVLSPFAILGLIFITEGIQNILKLNNIMKVWPLLFSIFLCLYFLFSSGLVNYFSNNPLPYSINLGIDNQWNVYTIDEVAGTKLLIQNMGEKNIAVFNSTAIISSRDGCLLEGETNNIVSIEASTTQLTDSYVFLGKYSLNTVSNGLVNIPLSVTPFFQNVLEHSDKIIATNNSNIYLTK